MKKQILLTLLLLTSTFLYASTPVERAAWAKMKDKEMPGGKMIGFMASGKDNEVLKLVYLQFDNQMYEAMKPTYKAKNGARWGTENLFKRIYYQAKVEGFKKIELTDLNSFKKTIIIK